MATIRLKKRASSGSAGAPSSLAPSEVAFNEADKVLYYGYGDAGDGTSSSIISVAGEGAVMHLGNVNQTAAGNKTFSGNLTVGGNLTVNGTTSTLNTTNSVVKDKLIELGNGTSGSPSGDAGIVIERGSSSNAFIGWDESSDKFTVGTGTFTGASTGDLSITKGTLDANLTGNVTGNVTGNTSGSSGSCTGNAATSTALANGRTVGMTGDVVWTSASFDGTGNVTGTATIQAGSVERTMLDLVSTSSNPGLLIKGDGSSVAGYLQLNCHNNNHGIKLKSPPHSAAQNYTLTFPEDIQNGKFLTTDANGNLSWAAVSSTDTTYTAGTGLTLSGTVFSLTTDTTNASNISSGTLAAARLPNHSAALLTSGTIPAARVPTLNQNTTGSAATLTTARTIAGVSFNGSANISLNNNAITNGAGYVTSSIINALSASNLSSGTIPSARVGTVDGGTF